ncbi:urea ABC transporter ATP-binding protein UrtD [Bradyrhizobium lablabi]|uniref:urea ABC transporter ATP-binding protein UrtD n=1 Tax=Bradyrhizobium lablabi TaxID=722472 RepID=UPI001BA66C03|nr:urea ABC transporter ATP-binding protein UrtD [Bradyrhizobium lablabi]MBR0694037.1 urea ABC transporter ATP-binding protein UrtD [Bradyrhizobium lablabi]
MTTHLDLRDISVSFNGFKALNGLNLSVRKGELRCLIGPNGAGKTTALDIICGKVKPSTGAVTFDGTALQDLEEHEIARAGVGRKFQVPSVFRDLTVAENLEVARARRPGVWANLRWDVRRAGRADIERLAELIGLTEHLERPAAYLSHGQTQWLEIGMLVAQDVELILMDEPTAGMTAQETRKTAELFERLRGKHTLIVVEHDMGFVKAIGDIISVMHMGQLLAEGTAAEVEAHPEVRRAYLGSGGITNA